PRFGRSLPELARYFGIRLFNLARPRLAAIDGKEGDVLVICNSFIRNLDCLQITNARAVRMACVVRGDVDSFNFQSFSAEEGTDGPLHGPLVFLKRFDAHVFVSTRTRDNWTRLLGPRHEAYLLPNAIDEREVSELSAKPIEAVRSELGMEPEAFHVVVVGTIQKRKGQDIFALAADALCRALPNVRVHFVGGASPRWGGTEMVQALEASGGDRYRILGHREDALKFVRASDVAVMVSHSEAFPRTVAEYMALGKAIISTPVAGADEMILHGETGLIIPIGDHDELVKALVSVSADSMVRNRLGESARSRYYSEYSAARQEARFTEIFEQIDASFEV
ncbi:MAG: glycosyltransferase family 4 protein, partial [Georgfuchsia sp.]